MGTKNKSVIRWPFIVGYLGIITSMLACMAIGVGSTNAEQGTLQIDNGVVEVVDENGDLVPVAGTSTFELVGALEGMDPWVIAGTTVETNESTQIEEGLQVGDLVRVRGTILEDGTWLAYSIELAEEQIDPIIVLIGTVDSIDPWVVNGITLNVTADTIITGEITPGMLVRVEILLLEDGTWEVLSITPLGDVTETEGCITVVATVVSVTEDEIQFLGWPSMPLGSDVTIEGGDESEGVILSLNQPVLVVLCPSDGQIVIIQIIVIIIDFPPDDGGTEPPTEGERVLVCHKPNKNAHTLSLPSSAVPAHLGHGDTLGPCP
ncbi:MAG: DUF5666 domain-containing protein [Anaerolineae bacterium]|nr:DUF5666 domain-containing protein [Anaerolineae bacterium]MCI0610152.1 DUF5666 domain-containing protein [Anaerolineae bacterium]